MKELFKVFVFGSFVMVLVKVIIIEENLVGMFNWFYLIVEFKMVLRNVFVIWVLLLLLFCILDIGFIFVIFKLLKFIKFVFREEFYIDDVIVRESFRGNKKDFFFL